MRHGRRTVVLWRTGSGRWENHGAWRRRRVRPPHPHNTDVASGWAVEDTGMRDVVDQRADAGRPGPDARAPGLDQPGRRPRRQPRSRTGARPPPGGSWGASSSPTWSPSPCSWPAACGPAAGGPGRGDRRRPAQPPTCSPCCWSSPRSTNGLPAGDPAAVGRAGRRCSGTGWLPPTCIRVKIWSAGRGDRLLRRAAAHRARASRSSDDDQEALEDGVTRAELSDLSRPENQFERSAGRLLEVYRRSRRPAGSRCSWRRTPPTRTRPPGRSTSGSSSPPISVAVLLALLAMQLPAGPPDGVPAAGRRTRARAAARPRPGRLHRGAPADRRQPARRDRPGRLRLRPAGRRRGRPAARQGRRAGRPRTSPTTSAEASGRCGTRRARCAPCWSRSTRPNLERAGLSSALADLAARLRPRGIDVRIDVPDRLAPPAGDGDPAVPDRAGGTAERRQARRRPPRGGHRPRGHRTMPWCWRSPTTGPASTCPPP